MKKIVLIIFCLGWFSGLSFSQQINKVNKFLDKQNYFKAEKEVKKAFAKDSSNAEYYYYMGTISRGLGNYDVAMVYVKKAMEKDSNYTSAISEQGVLFYLVNDDTNNAISVIKAAIKKKPDNELSHNDLGCMYMVTHKYADGLKEVLISNKLKPNSPSTLYNLGCLYADVQKNDSAIYCFTQSLNKGKHCLTYWERGKVFYNMGLYKKAIKDFTKALKIGSGPNPAEELNAQYVYSKRALAWQKLGNESKYQKDMDLSKKEQQQNDE